MLAAGSGEATLAANAAAAHRSSARRSTCSRHACHSVGSALTASPEQTCGIGRMQHFILCLPEAHPEVCALLTQKAASLDHILDRSWHTARRASNRCLVSMTISRYDLCTMLRQQAAHRMIHGAKFFIKKQNRLEQAEAIELRATARADLPWGWSEARCCSICQLANARCCCRNHQRLCGDRQLAFREALTLHPKLR